MRRATAMLVAAALLVAACARGDPSGGGSDTSPREARPPARVAGPGGAASCVERYSPQTLPNRQFAFDGVVTDLRKAAPTGASSGGEPSSSEVTFEVRRWYRGERRRTLRLRSAVPLDAAAGSVDLSPIRQGERYLVSGDGGLLWGCGFTRPYSESEARVWQEALGG